MPRRQRRRLGRTSVCAATTVAPLAVLLGVCSSGLVVVITAVCTQRAGTIASVAVWPVTVSVNGPERPASVPRSHHKSGVVPPGATLADTKATPAGNTTCRRTAFAGGAPWLP